MRLFDLRPALYAKEEQEEKAIAIAAALPNRSSAAPALPSPDPERPSTRINPNLRRIQRRRSSLPSPPCHALLSSFSSEEVEFVPDFKVDLCIVFPLPPPPPPSCQPVSHFLFQICLPSSFVSVPGAAVC